MESREVVLVVDDDGSNRMLVAEILQDEGFKVVEAEGGVEASKLLMSRARDFALVLTDFEMPGGITGMDVLRTAKEHDPELPVVVVSGFFLGNSSEQARFMAAGAAGTVAKPFSGEALVDIVKRCARN